METRMKTLLPAVALVGALSAASAQQSATADDAKALLARAATAIKADKPGALARFDAPNGGFKDRDLYVFCFDRRSGIVLAGPPTTKGRDIRTLRDPTGKMFGQEMFANVKDGDVITEDYMFPKPNSTVPVAKESFIEGSGMSLAGSATTLPLPRRSETYREWPGSTMPVPSSWGSIRREPSTKPASGVSIRPYPG
jgi:hypothetical protein